MSDPGRKGKRGGEVARRMDEFELIARYFAPLAREPGARGLIDDAASLVLPAGQELVLTVDAVIEGVHFPRGEEPGAVARKALRVNLSDLAAKGARPIGYLLVLALPDDWSPGWLEGFTAGLAADQTEFGLGLFGGDTVKTPGPPWVSITAFGEVPVGRMVERGAARPGDRVFVSGGIGDAALGLLLHRDSKLAGRWGLSEEEAEFLLDRYSRPRPRIELREALLAHASAAMDISDGLVGDLDKMCRASGLAATIACGRVPHSGAVRKAIAADPRLVETALTGGDDYEILAAVPAAERNAFARAAAEADIPVAEIGAFAAGEPGVSVTGPEGAPMSFAHGSYTHF
jgi:thiamine-monophosphate kinase